jgi:hypothetical protein
MSWPATPTAAAYPGLVSIKLYRKKLLVNIFLGEFTEHKIIDQLYAQSQRR